MRKRIELVYKTVYAWRPLSEGLSVDAEKQCAFIVKALGNMQHARG